MYTPGLSFIQLFDWFQVFRAGYNFDSMGCTCMCNEKMAISHNLCFHSILHSVIVTNLESIVHFIKTHCYALDHCLMYICVWAFGLGSWMFGLMAQNYSNEIPIRSVRNVQNIADWHDCLDQVKDLLAWILGWFFLAGLTCFVL